MLNVHKKLSQAAVVWAITNCIYEGRRPIGSIEHTLKSGLRLDALAFGADGATFGFEIKSSIADFKADSKYHLYHKEVDYLFLVFVNGLIAHDQIPADFGILEFDRGSGYASCTRMGVRAATPNYEYEFRRLMFYGKPITHDSLIKPIDVFTPEVLQGVTGSPFAPKFSDGKKEEQFDSSNFEEFMSG